jgi:hypothetical protein
MRSTKNRPVIDALDMPGLEDVGSSMYHNSMGLYGLLQGWLYCFFTGHDKNVVKSDLSGM